MADSGRTNRANSGWRMGWVVLLLAACATPTPPLEPFPQPTTIPTSTAYPSPTQSRVGICSTEHAALVPDFQAAFEAQPDQNLRTPVLDFLNRGGAKEAVIQIFSQHNQPIFEGDLTGDAVPELGVFDSGLAILGCVNARYEVLLTAGAQFPFRRIEIASTLDLNLNSVPDLVVYIPDACGSTERCSEAFIYEWDGQTFQNMVQNDFYGTISMWGAFRVEVKDVDGNGTQELTTQGGIPPWPVNIEGWPWRVQTDTYMWNGAAFGLAYTEFEPPQYRFQAVQDGDRAMLRGDDAQALNFYQQAIHNNALEWWSPERRAYEQAANDMLFSTPIPLLVPTPDPAEYSHLAAYARYRMLLLYVQQNKPTATQQTYQLLQTDFPAGQPGHPYAELAVAFWVEYQTTANLAQACAKAIEYATDHQADLLRYLGNSAGIYYYGRQSLDYTPADMCPLPLAHTFFE